MYNISQDGFTLNCTRTCNELIIPSGLTGLRNIFCFDNRITTLVIPPTLTNLEMILCYSNFISNLVIPHTLTNLQVLM